MFAEETDGLVAALVEAEYSNAVAHYGATFPSADGTTWRTALLEEVEEIKAEIHALEHHVKTLFQSDSNDEPLIALDSLAALEFRTKNAIKEGSQICAVAEKIRNSLNKKEKSK